MTIGLTKKKRSPLLPGEAEEQLLESSIPKRKIPASDVSKYYDVFTATPEQLEELEQPPELSIEELLGNVFPTLRGTAIMQNVKQLMTEKPEDFSAELRKRGRTPDTEALLHYFEFKPDEVDQFFQEPQVDLEPLVKQIWPNANIKTFAAFVRGYEGNLPPTTSERQIEAMQNKGASQFIEAIQTGGWTKAKQDLLQGMGLNESDIQEVLGTEGVKFAESAPVLHLEPEWRNIRTGEVIASSVKARKYPKGYEAELDEWTLTTETARNYGGVFKVFAQSLTKVPKQLGAAILQAVQGQGGASVVNKDWADKWIAGATTDQEAFVSKVAEEYKKTRLPINVVDIAELPQNIAFSLASMGAGLAVGLPTALAPVPGARVAAWALGTAASGAVAYNMTTYQIMQQYLEVKNEEMIAQLGRGLTGKEEEMLKKDFSNQAMQYGLWEAIPEAISNLAFAKILTMPLGKMVGRNIASKIIGKLFSLYGEELLTETITQKGQSAIEVEAGLRENKISWIEAFKEVAPQTFLLTTIMGGAGQIGVSAVQKIKQSLKREAGDSAVFKDINENITENVFNEVEAEAIAKLELVVPPTAKAISGIKAELPGKPEEVKKPTVPAKLSPEYIGFLKTKIQGKTIEDFTIKTEAGPAGRIYRIYAKDTGDFIAGLSSPKEAQAYLEKVIGQAKEIAVPAEVTPAPEVTEKPPLVAQPSQEWDRLSTSSKIKLIQAVPLGERTKIGLTTEDANRTWRSLPSERKVAISKAQVPTIPKAPAGMPEAGVQETMLPAEVSAKEVFPKGKGVPTQISMDEAAKLQTQRREAAREAVEKAKTPAEYEEAKEAERALLSEEELAGVEEFEKQGELEGLKDTLATDRAARYTHFVTKTGKMKGEISLITEKQVEEMYGGRGIPLSMQKRIDAFKSDPKHARWEDALDSKATEEGFADGQAFKEAIENAYKMQQRVKELESAGYGVPKVPAVKKGPPPTAIVKAQEISPEIRSSSEMTPEQATGITKMFGEMISHPDIEQRRALTIELRKRVLAQRASNAQGIAEQHFIEGKSAEEAINLAKKEAMPGKLPTLTAQDLAIFTDEFRTALFAKVYQYWKNDWFEMMNTAEALTHAIETGDIPMKRGTGTKAFPGGGSAYDRLLRTFGDQPEVVKALSQKKPLQDVIEGVFRESGQEPTPLDPEMVEYLRKLQDKPLGQPRLGEKAFTIPSLPPDTRTPAQKQIDLQKFKLELAPDLYRDWSPERLEQLSYLRINLLTSDYQAKLIEAKWIPPKPLTTDLRTPAQRALDLQEFATELAPPPVGVTQPRFEAPIEDAFKQKPLSNMTFVEKKMIVRVLKELLWAPVDIGNFLRATMTTLDQSFLRQSKVLASGHPVIAYEGHNAAWRATFSQKSAEAEWELITRDPEFQIYEEIRLKTGADPLRMPSYAGKKGTEQWRTAEEYGFPTVERTIPRITAKMPHIKPFERGFVTGTNKIVWGVWKGKLKFARRYNEKIASRQIKLPEGEGFSIIQEMTDHQKFLADAIQRATLPKRARGLAPVFSGVFFALRSKLGRFLLPRHLISSNPRVRLEAWKDFVLMNAIIGGTMLLGDWLDLWDTEKDPRNAEVMSARIGNTRIDPWAGLRQFVVLYARLATGTGISSVTGAEYEVNKLGALQNFIRGSLAPAASILLDFWTGRNFLGEVMDITDKKAWLKRVLPFSLTSMWEAFEENWKEGAISVIPAIYGEGVQTYTGDWKENFNKMGLPKYLENTAYGLTIPKYDAGDMWSDTASQFKGVDPATLTKEKGFPPYVKAMAEAMQTLEQTDLMPNEKLISINADPMKGGVKTPTFVDYYKMWRDRQKLVASGDKARYTVSELQADGKYKDVTYKGESALTAFDNKEGQKPAQSRLGNISQSQYALLVEYHSITDKKNQAKWLEELSEENRKLLITNSVDEWYKSHPAENAILAVHGKIDALTQKAYDLAIQMAKDWDYPDSSITPYLPPKDIAKTHFERIDTVDKWGANSWEDKLLRVTPEGKKWVEWYNKNNPDKALSEIETPIASLELKTIPKYHEVDDKLNKDTDRGWIGNVDDKVKDVNGLTARDRARTTLMDTKIPGTDLTYRDMERKVKAIEKGTNEKPIDPKVVDAYVKHLRIADEPGRGPNSAESMLDRVDNPDLDAFLTDKTIWAHKEGIGDDALQPIDRTKIPTWRIDVKYRKEDDWYNKGIPEKHDKITYANETLRDNAIATDRAKYRIDNKNWNQDDRRREAYALTNSTTGEKFPTDQVEPYVGYMAVQDKPGVGSSSAETMLYRVDNPKLDAALIKIKGSQPVDVTRIPIWRIDVKYQTEDAEYKAILDKYPGVPIEQRDDIKAFLAKPENELYRKDRRRREAYGLTNSKTGYQFPDEQIENFVAFNELSIKGKRRDRFLVENNLFAQALYDAGQLADIPKAKDVPAVQYDDIYDQFTDQFDEIEGNGKPESKWFIPNEDAREARDKELRFDQTGKYTEFGLAEIRRNAYGAFVPEKQVENYVGYYKIIGEGKPERWKSISGADLPWYEDDWFLIEHPDYYKEVYLGILKNERKDYRKVPTRKVFAKYLIYLNNRVSGKPREDYRFENPDLEDWLLLTGKVSESIMEKKRRAELSPAEKLAEEVAERLRKIRELGEPLPIK